MQILNRKEPMGEGGRRKGRGKDPPNTNTPWKIYLKRRNVWSLQGAEMRKRGWEVTASQRRSPKAGGDGGLMAAPISSHRVQPALDGQIPARSGKGIPAALRVLG